MDDTKKLEALLEDLRKSQQETLVTVTEIKGDNKLQSQVLNFHIEQLKEFKQEVTKLIEKQSSLIEEIETRVERLEKWQVRIIGVAAGAAAIMSIFIENVKRAITG
jgi:DNA repair exonuclease SbcCD ATPase subunit